MLPTITQSHLQLSVIAKQMEHILCHSIMKQIELDHNTDFDQVIITHAKLNLFLLLKKSSMR